MSKKAIQKTESRKTSTRAKRGKATEAAAPPFHEVTRVAVKTAPAASLEQIRDRAYQIFRTGVNPSDPAADWFQAERELEGGARI